MSKTLEATKAGEQTHKIKSVIHEGRQHGVIFGRDKYIITNDEFIHFINDNCEDVTLRGQYPDYKEKAFTVGDLKSLATDDLNLPKFGHYWGIKQRMAVNYGLLKKSMKKIGVSTEGLPAFGD